MAAQLAACCKTAFLDCARVATAGLPGVSWPDVPQAAHFDCFPHSRHWLEILCEPGCSPPKQDFHIGSDRDSSPEGGTSRQPSCHLAEQPHTRTREAQVVSVNLQHAAAAWACYQSWGGGGRGSEHRVCSIQIWRPDTGEGQQEYVTECDQQEAHRWRHGRPVV